MSARTPEGACVRVGLGLLIASFARPEYFLSFLLMSLLLAGLLAREVWRGVRKERARWQRALRTGAAYGLTGVALVAVMGNPFGNTSNRRFYAFCQHFADNYVRRTGLPVSPWDECNTVINKVFGEVDTLGAAARANPGAFLTHLGQNLQRYPRESVKMFAAGYGSHSPLPGKRPWTREQAGLSVYLGAPFRRVPTWTKRKSEPLAEYLHRERIDLVFMDGRLRQDPLFASDPALESFYAEPGAFGYATWSLPGTDVVLALPDAWASGRARAFNTSGLAAGVRPPRPLVLGWHVYFSVTPKPESRGYWPESRGRSVAWRVISSRKAPKSLEPLREQT